MAKGYTLKVKDNGAKRIVAEMTKPNKVLAVGVMGAEAAADHPKADATVGEVALWNEFGTATAPARSYLRDWADENLALIVKRLTEDYQRIVFKDEDEKAALEKRGSKFTKHIVSRIKRQIPPPNKAATLRRKNGSTPLIDTQTLIKAIKWEVT